MNSSLPTKPFRPHKPNILQWLFSHDALKPSALWFKLQLCLLQQWLAPRDVQKKVPAVQASSSCGWFRLGKNIRNDWDP
jgi:hypothetical protein